VVEFPDKSGASDADGGRHFIAVEVIFVVI
jgi:hypothetical protein